MSEKVKIYYFRKFHITDGIFRNSNRPATLEAIQRSRGEPFLETERAVDATDLDADGFLKKGRSPSPRYATG